MKTHGYGPSLSDQGISPDDGFPFPDALRCDPCGAFLPARPERMYCTTDLEPCGRLRIDERTCRNCGAVCHDVDPIMSGSMSGDLEDLSF